MSSSRPNPRTRVLRAATAGLLALTTAAALTSTFTATASGQTQKPKIVKLQVLALNDFHGNLAPPSGSGGLITGIPAGGAAYLATKLNTLRAKPQRTVRTASPSPPVT
jgi:5'-nucleotidase